MRYSLHVFFALAFAFTLPMESKAQPKAFVTDFSSAMSPGLTEIVRMYVSQLSLSPSETDRYASGDPYFTYIGGDSLDFAPSAHQFPDGSVVVGIETGSSGLPVTDNAIKSDYSGTGSDWYIAHFDPVTGETFSATYFGTDSQDWLSPFSCEDTSRRCLFAGGTGSTEAPGKTAGPVNALSLSAEFNGDFATFCQIFVADDEVEEFFANMAYLFGFGPPPAYASSKTGNVNQLQLGAGICGFRLKGDQLNGIVAIVNPGTCELENVLESTIETDDTFFHCFVDLSAPEPGRPGDFSPFPMITAVGARDGNSDLVLGEPRTPTTCWARVNDAEMTCSDMPLVSPVDAVGKSLVAENDQYWEIEQDPDVGTAALGYNPDNGFGFVDYWPSTDPVVLTSTAPVRVSTDQGMPYGLAVSNMGRISFTTDFVSDQTFFGRRIGTYVVQNASTGKAAGGNDLGALGFLNWTTLPGSNRTVATFDLDDYPFRRAYAGASFFGIPATPMAIQNDCPSGQNAACASYGEVSPGLSYISACNLAGEAVDVEFTTSSPDGGTECCGFFFDTADTGTIEPNTCSRLYSWPTEGGFEITLSGPNTPPKSFAAEGTSFPAPFSTMILKDDASLIDVAEEPSVPHTYAVYFTNTLDESVDLRVYGANGDLFSASLEPLTASVYNADVSLLGTEVYIESMVASGASEVFALTLPVSDFVLQSLVAAGGTGKSQSLEILVFNSMGTPAETRVVTAAEEQAELPTAHALHANYPNPFNPSTKIAFDLPERSDTRLDVINVFGQRIRSWTFEDEPAGRHSVTWDGADTRGVAVSSGVYLYRLIAGDFTRTRKMTLLR